MNNENYINLSTQSNYLIQRWIGNTLTFSDTDWFIGVFKISGMYKDDYGVYRQIVNESSLSRFYKAVDWTITTTRRKVKTPKMRFIPFIGGNKEFQVSTHVHAFIEIPNKEKYWLLHDTLKKNWNIFPNRSYKGIEKVTSDLWLMNLDKSLIKNHTSYCLRYEGKDFLNGTEKVLFNCKSCLM
jgi:hypothetical protein